MERWDKPVDASSPPSASQAEESQLEAKRLNNRANACFEAKDFAAAVRLYSEAIALYSTKPTYFTNRAAALLAIGRCEDALVDAETAIELSPKWVKGYIRKASALSQMGRMEEARQVYLLASKYEPNSQELNRRFEEIYAETLAPDSDEADDELFPPSETKQKTNGASSSLHISADDLECSLCLKLFYEPVTTPCGHTFCRSCLFRALDYRTGCPLCRSPIHFAPDHAVSVSIQSLIEKYFPKQLQKRRAEMEAERQEAETCMPLFLLNTVAFPGMRFPMHIFEPRYRLMLRRCLQGTKVFGLVNVQQNPTNMRWESSNAGCALKITKHTLLPDGRSFIETIGTKRFKILQKREQDGYIVGKIEWLEDEDLNEQDMARYDHLRERTRSHLTNMLHNLQCHRPLQPLLERMGDVPEDDASLCYWLASYLPIPTAEKQALLEDNSPLQRMEVLHCILAQIRSFVQSAQDEREERAASGASTSNVDDDGFPSQCLLS